MKERPILFSGPMVRAILEGRKTQTRRIVKPMSGMQKEWLDSDMINSVPHGDMMAGGWQMHHPLAGTRHKFNGRIVDEPYNSPLGWIRCPYGQPGDRLWVREEHFRFGHWEPVSGVRTKGGRQKWKFVADTHEILFASPESFRKGRHHKDPATPAWHKRLARFMPRAASRITLEITVVRVERLNGISEANAKAEGATPTVPIYGDCGGYPHEGHRDGFRSLWESINGEGSWAANPWVWVIEFRRLAKGDTK